VKHSGPNRWEWIPGAITLVASMWIGDAHASPPPVPRADPSPIIDGNTAPECAWPSVVALYSSTGRCTGFYIGGRVVVTAAHCMLPQLRVPIAGTAGGKTKCDTDADCPLVDAYGEPLTLTCPVAGSDVCVDPDPTKSSDVATALFGERYLAPGKDDHIRRSVDVAYCRRRDATPVGAVGGTPSDIAYCILREQPNVQPIPLAMHCEIELFPVGTPVTAVGFGKSSHHEASNAPGIKRFATSVLAEGLAGQATYHVLGGWSPGPPGVGDSGGPLLAALPDGTWRVIGVASTDFVEYVSPWPHVGWMLGDPNVVQSEILPCHTPQGAWSPGSGCGGFPLSPGTPSGSWGRGPVACFHPDIGGPSQTCGPAGDSGSGGADETGAASMGLLDGGHDAAGAGSVESPPKDATTKPGAACACQTRRGDPGQGFAAAVALAMLGLGRRRRCGGSHVARVVALGAVAMLLGGCPDNQGGTHASAGTTDDGGGAGPYPGPPPIDPNNPGYRGILGGIDPDPSIDYHDLAVGNVARAASSSECCQDYVIASPSTSVVRVLFAADLPGLTFLADQPDELVDVGGPGVHDVLLTDLDGDDRNDLVALRSDGNVAVVRGIAGPPGGPFFDPASLATFPAGAGAGAMTAADLDCDGDLDLAITAPSANAVVLLAGNGSGSFAGPLSRPAGSAPQDIATGDVDGDGDPDVAVSNDNGSFTIAINDCGGAFAAPVSYEIYPTTTTQMPIALGKLCPGHPNDLAVAVGIFDIVYLTCGNGTGSFANVVEPHGVQVAAPYDYFWDSQPGFAPSHLITDLFVGGVAPTLYAMRLRDPSAMNTSEIVWLPPYSIGMASGFGRPIATLFGGGPFREATAHALVSGDEGWNRIAFIGSPGFGASK
jgi:MYXO-CTERM domain-containing protein